MHMASNVDTINQILANRGDTFTIRFREVPKSSGFLKDAYEIQDAVEGQIAANPLIYAEDIKTMSNTEIAEYLENIHANKSFQLNGEDISGRGYILGHIIPHVVARSKESFYQKHGIVSVPYLDMCANFAVSLNSGYFTLKEAMMQSAGIRYDEIVSAAIKNREADYRICRMSELLGIEDAEDGIPLTVITSKSEAGIYGAGAILSRKILHEAFEKIGGEKNGGGKIGSDTMFILPSSVHEILTIPGNIPAFNDVESMRNMVREINAEMVAPDDVLTDSVYIWHDTERRLEVAE